MKFRTKTVGSAIVAAAVALAAASQARANAILEVISGTASVGSLVAPGIYEAHTISIGGWDLSFAEGTTQPATGTLASPLDDITSVNILRSGTKPLYIEFSAGGFTSTTPATMLATMSGANLGTSLSGSYSTYYSPTLFVGTVAHPVPLTGLLTSQVFSAGHLSGTATGTVFGTTPFALTQIIEITKGLASLDDTLQLKSVPDGGATMILLGGAMMGFALIRSKVGRSK